MCSGEVKTGARDAKMYVNPYTSLAAKWLLWAAPSSSFNASFHTSIKTSFFKVVYGHEPLNVIRYGTPKSPMNDLDKFF